MTILSFLGVEFDLHSEFQREKGHHTEALGLGLAMVHRLAEAARNRLRTVPLMVGA